MHLNGIVGALIGARGATDTPVIDLNLPVFSAANGSNRATDHADRIEATPASRWHQKTVITWPIQKQPRRAVIVSRDTGLDTITAARAGIQIDHQQLGSLKQAHLLEFGRCDQIGFGMAALQRLDLAEAFLCQGFHLLLQLRRFGHQLLEGGAANPNQFHVSEVTRILAGWMVIGDASRVAIAPFDHNDFADTVTT